MSLHLDVLRTSLDMTSQGGSAIASAVGNNPEPQPPTATPFAPSMSEGSLDPCSWPPSAWIGNESAPFASKTSPEHMPWEPRPSSWEWENSVLLPPSRADWGVGSRKSPNADGTRHIQEENKCGAFPFSLRSASQGLEDVVSAGNFAGHNQRGFFLAEEQRIEDSILKLEAKGKTEEQEDSSPSSGQQEMGKEAWSNSNASELKIRPPTSAPNMTDQEGGAAGTTGASSADALIGLKLGKRTYFEDSAVSKTASTQVSSLPSGKKPRPVAQPIQVPRCQVEGCKADLSDAKGYHRRHKVCEMHSKTPKNMVAGKEQRFCQQCSRFHVLIEFDEGKRSCRRRLEGHNQRRRKPPQEAFPGVGSCSLFSEEQRGAHILGDGSCFIPTHRGNSPSLLEDLANSIRYANENWSRYYRFSDQSCLSSASQTPGEERQLLHRAPLSGQAVDRLQMLLQAKRDPGPLSSSVANQGVHQFLKGSSIGQGLALSSSSSETGVLVGLSSPHGLAGIANSEGALSLLSFEPWTSRSCNSAPLEISASANTGIGQMINESAQRFVDEGSASGSRKLTSHSQSQSGLNISTSLSSSINVSTTAQEQHLPTTLRMIDQHHHQENRYMLNLMHGQMQPPNARTMMDLVHQKTVSSALQPASGRFG